MNDYLQRLVRPAVAAARTAPLALQEIDAVVTAPSSSSAPRTFPPSAPIAQPTDALATVTRWVTLPVMQPVLRPQAADAGAPNGYRAPPAAEAANRAAVAAPAQRLAQHESGSRQREMHDAPAKPAPPADRPANARPLEMLVTTVPAEAAAATPSAPPGAHAPSPESAQAEPRDLPWPAPPAARTVRPPASAAPGGAVEVHVGTIALTVRAPAPSPVPVAAPAVPAAASAWAGGSQRAAAPRREGLRFSASRHYLRWS